MKNMKTIGIISLLLLVVSVRAQYVPFKVKLNIMERFVVQSLLPKETNYATHKIINDLRTQLAPTEEELAKINLRATPDGGSTADWDAVPEKEFVFGEISEGMIKGALEDLDKKGKLLQEHLSVYEKFIKRESK